MEEQEVIQCHCTRTADAPMFNFGWTRQEFCAVISEGQLTGVFTKFLQRFAGDNTLLNLPNYYADFKAKMYRLTENEDIAHNAVYDALAVFPKALKRETSNGTWLCYKMLQGLFYQSAKQYAIRELNRHNRHIRRHVEMDANDNSMIDEEELADLLETTRSNIDLNRVLDESTKWLRQKHPDLYTVFDLKINQELSHADIARQLDISKNLSEQRHKRAKEHLQRRISEEMRQLHAVRTVNGKPRFIVSLLRKL